MPDKPEVSSRRGGGANDPPAPLFHIVSPNTVRAHELKSILDTEFGADCTCHNHFRLRSLLDRTSSGPCLYLLDCLKTDPGTIERYLDLGPTAVPDTLLIALFNVDAGYKLSPLVKRFKVRGFFYQGESEASFIKGMHVIVNGHLWLTRKMLSDCVLMAPESDNSQVALALRSLSSREKEILRHVGLGESNQEIATAMNISPHTVKTHLYNIYKKINVPNRLQGTLWAAAYLGGER